MKRLEFVLHRLLIIVLLLVNAIEVVRLLAHGHGLDVGHYSINLLWAACGVFAWRQGELD